MTDTLISDELLTDTVSWVRIASPETIRFWSKGEVKNPETINYRTFKPERGGLFCERIFGPVSDFECSCGRYKRIKHKGVICDRCGVEVALARVRRERMGHIELAAPVTHIWFFKGMPSRIGLLLGMSRRTLERIIYFDDYVVIEPRHTGMVKSQILNETEFRHAVDSFGDNSFEAGMGAEAIRRLLSDVDLAARAIKLEEQLHGTRAKQTRKKLAKRLKLVRGLYSNKTRPEWMVLEVLPVIPPDLRPLVPLEGGRFATSDLNELYRRVINRNNRLRNLLQLKTPDVIVRNEKRMLQEAVDALLDNGRHGRAVTGAGNRPLKSLSDTLKVNGVQFRQNLMCKRVDYSGRSVIVVGPELKLHQCGLPKKMALVLFEPFIIRVLKQRGYVHTVRSAKKMIERKTPEVWEILEQVTQGQPVLLNRSSTLHRLSVQAFEPLLIEGEAIRIHPLVYTAHYNDFDGDEIAVHVPLSVEAQMEARILMLASINICSPSSGKPVMTPSQDIILGCYYLTLNPRKHADSDEERLPLFDNASEVEFALADRSVKVHDLIRFRNPNRGRHTVFGDFKSAVIETTVGRVIFNEIWPAAVGFFNQAVCEKQISDIILRAYQTSGIQATVEMLDRLKGLGFLWAMRAGVSIGIKDMIIPKEKRIELESAHKQVGVASQQYKWGMITDGERSAKVVDAWTHAVEEIANATFQTLKHNEGRREQNPLFLIADSGALGKNHQVMHLAGVRGLISKPDGSIIEQPITANFREGLNVCEYFISTYAARDELVERERQTTESESLVRELVNCVHDVVIAIDDCGDGYGISVQAICEGDSQFVDFSTRIVGRTSCETVKSPDTLHAIVERGMIINESMASKIAALGVKELRIRSVLTCRSKAGICSMCYGRDMVTGKRIGLGEAVGIIAAQAIGSCKDHRRLRTLERGTWRIQDLFYLSRPTDAAVISKVDGYVEISTDGDGNRRVRVITPGTPTENEYLVPPNKKLTVSHGEYIQKGQKLSEGLTSPQDLFQALGKNAVEDYLLKEVHKVFLSKGEIISDKHIEIIIRHMLRKVKVTEPGDTLLSWDEVIDWDVLEEENGNVKNWGGQPAEGSPVLTGINEPCLRTKSFFASLLHQDAISVLTEASTTGNRNKSEGLEDHLIRGQLIPAGTGFNSNCAFQIKAKLENPPKFLDSVEEVHKLNENETHESLDMIGVIGC